LNIASPLVEDFPPAWEGSTDPHDGRVLTKLSLAQFIGETPRHMSNIIDIHEAKTHLSRIVDEVAAGKEVIIAKAGKPFARLSAISPSVKKRSSDC
jgi:prevent-host-death family protein